MEEIKYEKSQGYDDIAGELIKSEGENTKKYFHRLCVTIWKEKLWSDDWAKSVFIPIPKKGDKLECSNNRTIVLISHYSEILLKIIVERMKNHLEIEIAEEQHGFRPGKGTRDQILNLKMLIEKNREQRKICICAS